MHGLEKRKNPPCCCVSSCVAGFLFLFFSLLGSAVKCGRRGGGAARGEENAIGSLSQDPGLLHKELSLQSDNGVSLRGWGEGGARADPFALVVLSFSPFCCLTSAQLRSAGRGALARVRRVGAICVNLCGTMLITRLPLL